MPVQETEIEPTEEIHPILEKMEHEKFYRLTELYEMTYGQEFYVDFQKNDEQKTLWLFVAKVLNLKTYLEVLVILGDILHRMNSVASSGGLQTWQYDSRCV